jgi:hypothetical protein
MNNEIEKNTKPFKVAFLRDLEKQVSIGEISYSRMVEILNEKADEYAQSLLAEENESVMKECEHYYVPFGGGEHCQTGLYICSKCNHKI